MYEDLNLMIDLGGNVTFEPPPVMDRVESYVIYLAADPAGLNRSRIVLYDYHHYHYYCYHY